MQRAETEASSLMPDNSLEGSRPGGAGMSGEQELMRLFAMNQLRTAAALPVLAFLLAVVSLGWVALPMAAWWLAAVLMAHAIQMHFCRRLLEVEAPAEQPDRAGMIRGSELLIALCWSLPLFLFWPGATAAQEISLFAFVMAVLALRLLIVNNVMPVLLAGTGFLTLGVAVRCISVAEPAYLLFALAVVALEAMFLLVARQLHASECEMLARRAEKDARIARLESDLHRTRQEKRRAEEASKAKSEFLARMSHDLRTPLTAIMGLSDVLRREMLGPLTAASCKDYARDIHQSGRHLAALLDGLTDLSRIEAGRREAEDEPVSLHAAVEEACQLVRLQASEKAIGIALDLPPNLPRLLADRRALHQMLMNLVSSAVDSLAAGGRVSVRGGRSPEGGLFLSIVDDGPASCSITGPGLGLSIARELLEAHGGTLTTASATGSGNEVTLSFPESRVLSGPRGEVLTASAVASDTQRKLISLTG